MYNLYLNSAYLKHVKTTRIQLSLSAILSDFNVYFYIVSSLS